MTLKIDRDKLKVICALIKSDGFKEILYYAKQQCPSQHGPDLNKAVAERLHELARTIIEFEEQD